MVAFLPAVVVFIRDELMTAERVCIREVVIQLDSSSKELEGCLVFLLETVTITYDTPRLRGKQRLLKCLIR